MQNDDSQRNATAAIAEGAVLICETPQSLANWIKAQEERAAANLLEAVSATHLGKHRPGFGQSITPAPGSVLASPVDASWDPEPDYFFHWLRDAAIAMDAARLMAEWPAYTEIVGWELGQYVAFSQRLAAQDGRARLAEGPLTRGVAKAFLQYVRPADEMALVHGDAARGDVRFNPDGTLDITRWSRPQYDGVALRALGLLRCTGHRDAPEWVELIAGDLDCVARHVGQPCVDLWEEEEGFHLHTMLTGYAALRAGEAWPAAHAGWGLDGRTRLWREAADEVWTRLQDLRDEEGGWIISRMAARNGPPVSLAKLLDGSVILGVIHAGLETGPFSVDDPLAQGALIRLERHYAEAFPVNQRRPPQCAPLLGRNPGDVYFDGGAWPLITLAAAEFRFRLAMLVAKGDVAPEELRPELWFGQKPARDAPEAARLLIGAGEMGFAAVRSVTPEDGDMAEQADRETGAPRSARRLTWNFAAFLTAAAARRAALEAVG